MKWAYRKSSGDSEKQPVLLLHGIGSNSYQYRDLMRLLSLSGHDCYAPDWIGHGSSDKVRVRNTCEFAYNTGCTVHMSIRRSRA